MRHERHTWKRRDPKRQATTSAQLSCDYMPINTYPLQPRLTFMHALCLINVKPGKVDNVIKVLQRVRKAVKEIMVVTGRADIIVVLQGTMDEINNIVIDFKKIKEIVSTETLIEVEVDLGWSKP